MSEQTTEWIDADERKPEPGQMVIVTVGKYGAPMFGSYLPDHKGSARSDRMSWRRE